MVWSGLEEYRDVIIVPPYKSSGRYTQCSREEVRIRVVRNAGKARAGGRGSRSCMYPYLCGALGNERFWLSGRRVRCTVTELRWPEPERSLK